MKHGVGIIVACLTRKHTFHMPGVPYIDPPVLLPAVQPELVCVEQAGEGWPGHHDNDQRQDENDRKMIAQPVYAMKSHLMYLTFGHDVPHGGYRPRVRLQNGHARRVEDEAAVMTVVLLTRLRFIAYVSASRFLSD